jgi:hypothetical protein
MATPPTIGTRPLWDLRPPGSSTSPMRRASGRSTSSKAVVITNPMTEAEMAGKMLGLPSPLFDYISLLQWQKGTGNMSVDGDTIAIR